MLVKKLVDNNHKTLKNFRKEIVEDDEILNNVNEIETSNGKVKYKNDSIEELKKSFPYEIQKLDALNNYISENDLKISKTEFPDKWTFLSKQLAYAEE